MKIVTVLGARPQFIKASSVSYEILCQKKMGANIEEIIVHTGQHYDNNMSHIFFDQMKIPKPDYFLGVNSKTHGAMTGQMIEKIEEVLFKENPEYVLVYGDTNSTLAGAIAASKLHIKVAHVESGLRSFNISMPEEVNRILTDRVSTLLFCPSQNAINNLTNEAVEKWKTNAKVILSGDVMQDSALFYKNLAKKPLHLELEKNFILCTIHRAENTDNLIRLANILSALNEIAQDKQVVIPLHPRTKKIINSGRYETNNLTIIEPVGYLNMIWLVKHCGLVFTDSGGLQKESFFFKKSCITLRGETEWFELVDNNFNVLAPPISKNKIINCYTHHKFSNKYDINLYGHGKASQSIVKELLVNRS